MENIAQWIRQGDLFLHLPILRTVVNDTDLTTTNSASLAILLTQDCQIDKCARKPTALGKCLTFAPVRSLVDSGLSAGVIGQLRGARVSPAEAIYLSDTGEGEEGLALLGESFHVPAHYFDLNLQNFSEDPRANIDDQPYSVANRNGERTLSMEDAERRLMQHKMFAYWTGQTDMNGPQ